jgi:NAD(P)-dependent dehydrogenase (short-subunit alcohol dehydrogenase family)
VNPDAKVAIVTGGANGIGESCVRRLAADGYAVLIADLEAEPAEAVAASLPQAEAVVCDVSDPGAIQALAARALDRGDGRIAAVVNAAGMTSRGVGFADSEPDVWRRLEGVNTHGVLEVTRVCLGGLQAARGAVVNVSSVAGLVGVEGLTTYSMTKAAVIALTRSLALEYGATIRVNAVAPGEIATRMMARIADDPYLRALSVSRIPAGRMGEAEDVADVIVWLLSDGARYVNGVVIPVDGGLSAGYHSLEAHPVPRPS